MSHASDSPPNDSIVRIQENFAVYINTAIGSLLFSGLLACLVWAKVALPVGWNSGGVLGFSLLFAVGMTSGMGVIAFLASRTFIELKQNELRCIRPTKTITVPLSQLVEIREFLGTYGRIRSHFMVFCAGADKGAVGQTDWQAYSFYGQLDGKIPVLIFAAETFKHSDVVRLLWEIQKHCSSVKIEDQVRLKYDLVYYNG